MTLGLLDSSNPAAPVQIIAPYGSYSVITPYTATYSMGSVFVATIGGATYSITLASPATPTQLAVLLTNLGKGFWSAVVAGSTTNFLFVPSGAYALTTLSYTPPIVASGWVAQTSGTSNALNSVFFTSTTNGVAVGNTGTALYTTNGGATWSVGNTGGQTCNFNSLFFTSALNGFATGTPCSIPALMSSVWSTTDGGVTWGPISPLNGSPSTTTLAVFFVGTNNGWVSIGNSLYTTSNGGTSWTHLGYAFANSILSIYMISTTVGWCCDSAGGIFKTINGGTTWTAQTSGTASTLYSIAFTDANNGWAAGVGGIFYTSNGGATWTNQYTGSALQWIEMFSGIGWAVGDSGTILYTSNGGTTWTPQTSGTSNSINSIVFTDANNGWAVGASGLIINTTTGGN